MTIKLNFREGSDVSVDTLTEDLFRILSRLLPSEQMGLYPEERVSSYFGGCPPPNQRYGSVTFDGTLYTVGVESMGDEAVKYGYDAKVVFTSDEDLRFVPYSISVYQMDNVEHLGPDRRFVEDVNIFERFFSLEKRGNRVRFLRELSDSLRQELLYIESVVLPSSFTS